MHIFLRLIRISSKLFRSLTRKKIIIECQFLTMIFKEFLVKLTTNTIRLHFETDFLVDFAKEVSFFQKTMLI